MALHIAHRAAMNQGPAAQLLHSPWAREPGMNHEEDKITAGRSYFDARSEHTGCGFPRLLSCSLPVCFSCSMFLWPETCNPTLMCAVAATTRNQERHQWLVPRKLEARKYRKYIPIRDHGHLDCHCIIGIWGLPCRHPNHS